MKEILNKKILWVVLALTSMLIFTNLFSDKIISIVIERHYEEISKEVVKKLQKEYCPSPYGPGIDPDKINVDELVNSKEWKKTWGEQKNDSE